MAIPYEGNERLFPKDADIEAWAVEIVDPGGQLQASGPCPECGDETQIVVLNEIVVAGAAAAAALPDRHRTTRKVRCLCPAAHDGRPAGVARGCGRWWLADFYQDQDQGWVITPATNDRTLAANEALDQASENQVTEIRKAAEKWLPGVAALYGLFGLSGLIAGRDTVDGFDNVGKVLIALAALAGLVSTGFSIGFGYRAAYGWPKSVSVANNQELMNWYSDYQKRAKDSAVGLRRSIIAAVVAVGMLVLVVGLIWFLPVSE